MNHIRKITAVCLLCLLAGCGQKETVLTGEVESTEIDVSVKIPGRIAEISVHEGDTVKKGDILGRLQSREMEAKLQTVQAAMAEARDQFEFAEKTYNRVKNLTETNVIPRQQFDEATYKYQAAKQKLEAVQGQLNEVRSYYDEMLLKAAKDGEVVQIISHPGEIVSPGYPVLTLTDPADIWVTCNVREDRLSGITKGAVFRVTFPAISADAECSVTFISPLGAFAKWKATNEQGSFDLKTFEVRLRPAAPVAGLRPGMTALIHLAKKR